MTTRIQMRRATAEEWSTVNPVLADGEWGYVQGSPREIKIGDGETAWNDLDFIGPFSAYKSVSAPMTNSYLAKRDTSLDINVTSDSNFTILGDILGTVVGMRIQPNGHVLTLPGDLEITGSEAVTATAWRMNEGWVYSVAGATTSVPDPGDTVPPVAGTLQVTNITDGGFTLTVAGATDELSLHSQPYSFSIDGGATWSSWQASSSKTFTGLLPDTEYLCQHQTRDNADPYHAVIGTEVPVTTDAIPGVLTYLGESHATADTDTFTYSNVPIGAASAGRHILVALSYWAGGSRDFRLFVDNVEVSHLYSASNAQTDKVVRFYKVPRPTGTTMNLEARSAATGFNAQPSIAAWSANQDVSLVAGNFTDVASGATGGSVTATSEAGGFALAAFRTRSGAFTSTWTNITERWDGGNTSNAQPTSGGDMQTSGSSSTATVAFSVASNQITRVALACFRWGAA